MASLIRVALGGTQVDLLISPLKDRYGSSLLHYAAEYLGAHHSVSTRICLAEELRNKGVKSKGLNLADTM